MDIDKDVAKFVDYLLWLSTPAIKCKLLEEIGTQTEISGGCLLIKFTFGEDSKRTPSDLFRMIQDGSLLQILEVIVFHDEFRQSIKDVSNLDIVDSSTRQQLIDVLDALSHKMSLTLEVNLQQMMDLLFDPSCTNVIVKLSPTFYRPTAIPINEVFDKVFPVLSEILLKPLNNIDMTEAQSK